MDVFYICWTALVRESQKHQVFIWNSPKKGFGTRSDHSILVNRLGYVYLRGTLIIHQLQCCVFQSITNQTLPLYYALAEKSNCNVCCLSNGAGLETIGFLRAFRKHIYDFKSVSVTVVTKFREWHDFSESLICENLYHPSNDTYDYYSPNSFEFISCDLKRLDLPSRQCVQTADVIIMYKCFPSADVHGFSFLMKEITALMKKDALLFSLHSKAKSRIFSYFQDIGTSLCSPLKIKLDNLPYDPSLAAMVGMPPRTKGTTMFTLWQKGVSTKASSREIESKNDIQSQGLNTQSNSYSLKYGSESSLTSEHSSLGTSIDLSGQKLDVTPSNLPNSSKLFCQPKSNSEIVENAILENNSSDFKEDIPSSIVSEVSSETVVKCLESNVLSGMEDSKWQSDFNNVHKSDKECETDLKYDLNERGGSKLDAVLEHCEKMVDSLEKRITDLRMQQHSCKNVCNNCCTHHSKHICHDSHLASYHECNYLKQSCCHDCNCLSLAGDSNAEAKALVSQGNNVPYLKIPLHENSLFDLVSNLTHKNAVEEDYCQSNSRR